jgi:hypothetical protein
MPLPAVPGLDCGAAQHYQTLAYASASADQPKPRQIAEQPGHPAERGRGGLGSARGCYRASLDIAARLTAADPQWEHDPSVVPQKITNLQASVQETRRGDSNPPPADHEPAAQLRDDLDPNYTDEDSGNSFGLT